MKKTKIRVKKLPSLPTYKEMWDKRVAWMKEFDTIPTSDDILSWDVSKYRDSLTPHTTEYLLKDRTKAELVYNDVTESLKLLEVERLDEGGLSVVSAMEPADGEKYLNNRLDTLSKINKYLTDMMENIESQLVEHLNSYDEGE